MPLLLLVRLQDLEELLIRVRVPLVPLLDLAQVVDRVVELAVLRLVRLARVEAPEERGVVAGYAARLAPERVGFGLLAFVFVRADEGGHAVHTERALAAIPEVQEVHHITGEDCFLVKVRTRDTGTLGQLLRERIVPGVTELEISDFIIAEMTKRGATHAFATCQSGVERSGEPFMFPAASSRVLEDGDLVHMEINGR